MMNGAVLAREARLLLVVFPQKPVQCYLGAEDGEEYDEEEGDPEHDRTECPSEDTFLAVSALWQAGAARHGLSPFSLGWWRTRPASLCSSSLPSVTRWRSWMRLSVRLPSDPSRCSLWSRSPSP